MLHTAPGHCPRKTTRTPRGEPCAFYFHHAWRVQLAVNYHRLSGPAGMSAEG